MKNKWRVQFVLFLILFIFSSCLKQDSSDVVKNDSVFDLENFSNNERIVVKSASELDYPPFSVITEEGLVDGFSVELLRASLDRVGLGVNYYVGPWSEIKTDLAEGRIQVLPLVGRTPEREEIYDFTVPYISIYGSIFVRRENTDISNLADLWGKEVLVMKDDNAEEFVRREKISDKIVTTNSYEEAFKLLAEGEYDAIITQEIIGKQLIEKLNLKNVLAIARIDSFKQDFTFAVQEGDTTLLAKLNDGLSKIISDGTFDKIYNKWLKPSLMDNKSIDEEFVRLNANKVADEINTYLIEHPNFTVEDLQADPVFKSIAIQKVGNKGYTGIVDSETGYIYFHPQKKLVNTDSHLLKEQLPAWWKIFEKSVGPECSDASGYYNWKEGDNAIIEKFMSLSCVETPTAEGSKLLVFSSFYIDNEKANQYIEKYGINSSFENYQLAIEQKAEDVAKQVEIYLRGNPNLTVKDLQNDEYFQGIAVQVVGDNGYTSIIDIDSSEQYFSGQEEMVGRKLSDFKDSIPALWDVFENKIKGQCLNEGGFYSWPDSDGGFRDKYVYSACVKQKTADNKNLAVNASVYIDTYSDEESILDNANFVARQVDQYLVKNPSLTLKDLQNDPLFWSIAVQNTDNEGYTGVVDSETGYFYFHPQDKLVGTDYNNLKEKTPSLWRIWNNTIGEKCYNSSGYYDWIESDGEVTKKFLANNCVKEKTADGKKLFVFSSAYLNKNKALKYIDKYQISYDYDFSKVYIKNKSEEVAREAARYLEKHPNLSLEELKNDSYFNSITVQQVGVSGYTASFDYDSLITLTHNNPKIIGVDLHTLSDKLPEFWAIMSRIKNDNESFGAYKWKEADGTITNKYMHIIRVNRKTADGFGIAIAATMYLDDYLKNDFDSSQTYGNSLSLEYSSIQQLSRDAEVVANNIALMIDGFKRNIRSLALASGIEELLIQVNEEGVLVDTENEKRYIVENREKYWDPVQDFLSKVYSQNTKDINMLSLFYRDGYVISGTVQGKDDVYNYKGDKSWYRNAMDREITGYEEVYISPISMSRINEIPVIRYVAPIDANKERLGFIIMTIKADSIFEAFHDSDNVLFLDKKYENAEGEISNEWVVTLADSRNKNFVLSEKKDGASEISTNQLVGDSGVIEFRDKGVMQTGAYQKINVLEREWYIVSFNNSEDIGANPIQSEKKSENPSFSYSGYVYLFIAGLAIIFLALLLLYYFKILKLERTSLTVILIFFFVLVSGMFIFGSRATVNKLKYYFKDTYIEQNLQLGNLLSDEIVELVDDVEIELEYMTKSLMSSDCITEDCSDLLKGGYERNKEYVHAVYKTNKDNIIENMYPTEESVMGLDISGQDHVEKARRTKKPVFSNIIDTVEGFQGVAFQYPLIKDGEFNGVVDFLINIDDFFQGISLFSKHIHEHESFLLDSRGQIIATDQEAYLGGNILEIAKYKEVGANLKKILKQNEDGYDEFIVEGENNIAIYTSIRIVDNKMTLLLFGKERDAYLGLDSALKNIWIFTFITLSLFAIIGFLFSHFLTKSLRKEVDKKTTEIKKNSELLKEQLEKEGIITKEKEKLLKDQDKVKKKLEEKIEEMDRFNSLVIGRELKMVEMKKDIAKLKEEVEAKGRSKRKKQSK